ncbi:MAG: transglycosylase SLT domain-containing protein [Gammaproteobacteria bacterium]|nr:transglycosylase SLT domain-containing protein [Gammaproteobacteria bacterium]
MTLHHNKALTQTVAVVSLLLATSLAVAAAPASPREKFLQAEVALKSGDSKKLDQLKGELLTYPLYPYLQYAELRKNIRSIRSNQAERFLERYESTPLAHRFRKRWLKELARRKHWWLFDAFYHPTSNTRLQCLHIQALYNTGDKDEALAKVESIWLHGESQPKACDNPLKWWKDDSRLSSGLVWERFALAMEAGEPSLARYLVKQLDTDKRRWADLWLAVRKQPLLILKSPQLDTPHPYRKSILLYGIQRLSWQDNPTAWNLWLNLLQNHSFTEDEIYRVERKLALYTPSDKPVEQLARFNTIQPREPDEKLHEARLRSAIRNHDWVRLITWLNDLPADLRESDRWRYWHARALKVTGQKTLANAMFDQLAEQRSYYGFLAAEQTGKPYNLTHAPLQISADALDGVGQKPAARRAYELYKLGRLSAARSEWNLLTGEFDPAELQTASVLARNWGWNDQAIFTLAKTGYWDDLELRFPIKHNQQIEKNAIQNGIDRAWIYAVVRQESAFAADAQSGAGAMGLMQLMPYTAKAMARKNRQPKPKRKDLLKPETNIRLGSAYLKHVLNSLSDHIVLATAAYNAGPHRVKKWLPQKVMDADIWVETIPFKETRRYTQRVVTYALIYEHRLGDAITPLTRRMTPIHSRGNQISRSEKGMGKADSS